MSAAGTNGATNGKGPVAMSVENIVKRYGDFEAVKGISFSVSEGEIFGLLGPNGAGKSTLIRMMTTLIPVTAGKATVGCCDVSKDPDAVRRQIGVIPQALTSDPDLTVEENLRIYAKLYSVPRGVREKNIVEVLEAVDLLKWRGAQTKTLSGGMRRRLEIARGLVHNPRIFFLDEPTTGLDPVSRIAVWEMLNSLKNSRNLTMLLTTHYMEEADKLCDRIAIVDRGELLELDTPEALKQRAPGGTLVEVALSGDADAVLDAVKSLDGVLRAEAQGPMLRVYSDRGGRVISPVIQVAEERGRTVTNVSLTEPSLETLFVSRTGRKLD
jgi:ABC-2 type transport system ATP-binding protein